MAAAKRQLSGLLADVKYDKIVHVRGAAQKCLAGLQKVPNAPPSQYNAVLPKRKAASGANRRWVAVEHSAGWIRILNRRACCMCQKQGSVWMQTGNSRCQRTWAARRQQLHAVAAQRLVPIFLLELAVCRCNGCFNGSPADPAPLVSGTI